MFSVGGEKVRVTLTVTVSVSLISAGLDAVMCAVPSVPPTKVGCVAGVVWPPAMKTVLGVTLAFALSLIRVMVTPPTGAGVASVTGYVTDWPGATETFAGRKILPTVITDASVVPVR